jgi:8-hydroxy-5-deazaflavin:NADPH oxidoreductase
MKVGVIGSGIVGQSVGAKMASLGHSVVLGTRDPKDLTNRKGMRGMGAPLGEWLKQAGPQARLGTFEEAARHGELVVNATSGVVSLEALRLAGEKNLDGKVLLDISNELGSGMPPQSLASDGADGSIGVRIQKAFPKVKVVKSLNTMSAWLMVDPNSLAGGNHTVFISGNDAGAKEMVRKLLESFGWKDVFDLGDIESARGPEMAFVLWAKLFGQLGQRPFNLKVVR